MLYQPIYSTKDYESLQNDVDSLFSHSTHTLLNVNATKCKYMIISRKKRANHPQHNLNNLLLENVKEYKYLGLWLTTDLFVLKLKRKSEHFIVNFTNVHQLPSKYGLLTKRVTIHY